MDCQIGIVERDSQLGGESGNVEDMLLSMLDERDRLMVGLKEAREELQASQLRLRDLEKERDNLQIQLTSTIPAVELNGRTSQSWRADMQAYDDAHSDNVSLISVELFVAFLMEIVVIDQGNRFLVCAINTICTSFSPAKWTDSDSI
ncbi:unnamed protein product [Rodentolepis nana]|uniref:Liprin-alpha-2-like n=1 Tax=Rodentolepis nana TaxID=102285 RepID=A0A0R3TGU3_RODNA|nr:unnamed protein product [Rodentolepis nana]